MASGGFSKADYGGQENEKKQDSIYGNRVCSTGDYRCRNHRKIIPWNGLLQIEINA